MCPEASIVARHAPREVEAHLEPIPGEPEELLGEVVEKPANAGAA